MTKGAEHLISAQENHIGAVSLSEAAPLLLRKTRLHKIILDKFCKLYYNNNIGCI